MIATVTHRKSRKGESLVVRVSAEDKAILLQAAALTGQSIGSFVVAAARHVALETLESREQIVLTPRQSRRFMKRLLAPPPRPKPTMVRARRAYRASVKSDLDYQS